MKRLVQQMVRFGIVGIVSFLLDFILMIVLKEGAHMNIFIATTLSYTISVIFNYPSLNIEEKERCLQQR